MEFGQNKNHGAAGKTPTDWLQDALSARRGPGRHGALNLDYTLSLGPQGCESIQ